MGLRVVGAISLYSAGALAGATSFAADRRDGLDQGQELRHVVRVRAGYCSCQGNPRRLGN